MRILGLAGAVGLCFVNNAPVLAQEEAGVGTSAPFEPDAAAPLGATISEAEAGVPDARVSTTTEVTVHGAATSARALQESAEAVTVLDTRVARRRSADLGDVLTRVQGVSVRRTSGLGSATSFSLNGLYDDQIRFFLDGVPLELAGFPFGLANVPVNLVDRVEIYRGVVPIRFGADALGGAINLATVSHEQTRAAASFQAGSYGVQRYTFDAGYRHVPSGFVAAVNGFYDRAKNEYPIDVEVSDDDGTPHPATVKRFHDHYHAYGAALELGVVDRPWARKLLVRGLIADYEKQLQSNVVMTKPYGEVHYGEHVTGALLRYEQPLIRSLELSLVADYAYRTIDFVDKSRYIYDWYGERIGERQVRGEVGTRPSDQTLWQHTVFGRATLAWQITPAHALRAALTPSYITRTGEDRIKTEQPGERDPLSAARELTTFVSGLEYELNALRTKPGAALASAGESYRLQNVMFAKSYLYHMRGEELMLVGNIFTMREIDENRFGAGDSLRIFILSGLYLKASYEYATRLPSVDEVFGNGALVTPNLALKPEVSHNVNLGPHYELRHARFGELSVDINALMRDSDQLIVLLGGDQFLNYQNVYRARAFGVEGGLVWTSARRYLTTHVNPTWLDQRSVSDAGGFADTKGDRIPNRPYLFASWGGQLRFAKVGDKGDAFEPFYEGRYVHEFYRGWESWGQRSSKAVIPRQLTHDVGITYTLRRDYARLAATFELQNVTNAKVFDFYGAQRPGRAFYFKLSAEFP